LRTGRAIRFCAFNDQTAALKHRHVSELPQGILENRRFMREAELAHKPPPPRPAGLGHGFEPLS
jgi:hypothetical protein